MKKIKQHSRVWHFKMSSQLRSALALNDDLQFSDAYKAGNAILNNPEFVKMFGITEQVDYLEQWRTATIAANELINQ